MSSHYDGGGEKRPTNPHNRRHKLSRMAEEEDVSQGGIPHVNSGSSSRPFIPKTPSS